MRSLPANYNGKGILLPTPRKYTTGSEERGFTCVPTHLRLRHAGVLRLLAAAIIFCLSVAVPHLHAADNEQQSEEFDQYKLRIDGFWFYSNPSGQFQGSGASTSIDIDKDFGFNSYSTGTAILDWKFTHKNHLTFVVSPFQQSRTTTLNRTVTFQGQTYDVGLTTNANLRANLYAPGYQYDIFRRRRWHLGVAVQIDLFDANASLTAAAQSTGDGVHHAAVTGSASLLAPIPAAGPTYRFYLTDSPRLFVEGNLYGMYLFGYGNFMSTNNDLGLTINKYLSINAGYGLGSRLVVNNNASTRIGLHLLQQGPLVGLELSLGGH